MEDMTSGAGSTDPHIELDGAATAPALAALGLTADVLRAPLAVGEYAAAAVDETYPIGAAGRLRWTETVAALRRDLRLRGWRLHDHLGSPRVLSPAGSVALMIAAGDPGTGLAGSTPQVAHRKGPATERTVPIQPPLPGMPADLEPPRGLEPARSTATTWMLLYHRYLWDLRAEVSLPVGIVDGLVTGWRARILLPVLTFGYPARRTGEPVFVHAA